MVVMMVPQTMTLVIPSGPSFLVFSLAVDDDMIMSNKINREDSIADGINVSIK
jgi:hypothetical protein